MEKLLNREEFKEQVFARDNNKCVMCPESAVDAHHIMERKLFSDGGYYLSNGASLCSICHIKAEQTLISCKEIRIASGIEEIILPEGFDQSCEYDKWGNIILQDDKRMPGKMFGEEQVQKVLSQAGLLNNFIIINFEDSEIRKKYPRSLHAQISLGTTSDDRFMPSGYVDVFSKMDLIITEKLDGQNNCFNKSGVFARSHTAPSVHPWDKPMWDRWELIKNDLGDLEIFGENMFGIHSIEYANLESFYYVFAIRDKDQWLSWDEVKFYANMLDFPTVPELNFKHKLSDYKLKSENESLSKWFADNLGMNWEHYVNTPGCLGGFDPNTKEACNEGFVVRNKNGFKINEGLLSVADNEFDSLFKMVRKKHVKTDVHWTKTWRPATLMNYEKHKWYGYEHLNLKK